MTTVINATRIQKLEEELTEAKEVQESLVKQIEHWKEYSEEVEDEIEIHKQKVFCLKSQITILKDVIKYIV